MIGQPGALAKVTSTQSPWRKPATPMLFRDTYWMRTR